MKKKVNYWFQIVALLIGISALVAIASAVLFTMRSAPASPSTAPAPTFPANGYPGPTVQPSITPTFEPDYSATLAVLKTTPNPSPERPVGICECVDIGMLKMGYDLQNSWQRQINGHWVRVEVGGLQSDPDQGIVILLWEDAPGAGGRFKTPVKAGPVRIVAEHNNRLTLQPVGETKEAAPGTTVFYFDVPGRRFASSLTEIVPTAVISFSVTASAPTMLSTPTPAQAYP
jgi:hypothetical protein